MPKTKSGSPRERLDDLDRAILRLLQDDGRISNAELARRVGLSPPSVLQRVRRLETLGFVQRYCAHLDPGKMGFSLTVFAMVSISLHHEEAIETFRRAVTDIPEVLECFHVSGDFDFLLRVLVRDMADYERLIRERLSRIGGIGKIHSSFVLATTKSTCVLPL